MVARAQVRARAAAIWARVCRPCLECQGQGAAGAEGRPGRPRVASPGTAADGIGGRGL